ncbi:MAG: nuclear transport factor 2 family protein [Acidimicrobiales bacterium]
MAGSPRKAAAVVRTFWERMEARDWAGARTLLADDVAVVWPATRERFIGADAFIEVNQHYPGDWHIEVKKVLADKAEVLAWVEVRLDGQLSLCAQRAIVEDRKIRSSVDLWVDEGAETPPPWRVELMSRPRPEDAS